MVFRLRGLKGWMREFEWKVCEIVRVYESCDRCGRLKKCFN